MAGHSYVMKEGYNLGQEVRRFLPRSLMQAERDQDTCIRYAGKPWKKTSVPIKSVQRETERDSHMQQVNNARNESVCPSRSASTATLHMLKAFLDAYCRN
jgi:hypothetical protein